MPRLSVVTAVYNARRFLQSTVNSILNQTFTDLEYILVDDGSEDGSAKIIRSIKDPRIRLVLHECNRGLVEARNRGIAEARGEYVALTDADDISLPNRLADQVRFMDRNPDVGLLGTWAANIDQHGRQMPKRLLRRYSPEECRASLVFRNIFVNSTLLLRQTAIPTPAYAPQYPLCEDYNFIIQVSRKSQIYILPKVAALFRVHAASISSKNEKQMNELAKSLKAQLLDEIGLAPSPRQLEIHGSIEKGSLPFDSTVLGETQAWLEHIVETNANCRRYKPESLARVAGDEWFQMCLKMAARGVRTFKRYTRSPLATVSEHRQLSRVQLLYKSLLSRYSF